MMVGFVLILALVAWLGYEFVLTVIGEDFVLAAFLLWLVGFAAAYWGSAAQARLVRMPAGFLLFLAVSLVSIPASALPENRVIVLVLVVAQAAASIWAGSRISIWLRGKVLPRYSGGRPPILLAQNVSLAGDLGRFALLAVFGGFLVVLVPVLLGLMAPDLIGAPLRWMAVAWALVVVGVHEFKQGEVRPLRVPLGIWVFVAVAVLLTIFRAQLDGPDDGSAGDIAYHAYLPALAAVFFETVVIGTSDPA